ncbi:RNA polymerase sigma factor [Thermanaeromonas toyohensis ToBE]|uniref:RNA polymerase sigma factor SigI n=1 Tax=Thermanaeromonas toyohensis ToBE TaxID=698762 RepID=A0A1W1VZU1_9FIRM|nr:RNA polymerase sigma-I factor [Thermanaeromonas toyohensis]SMB98858.1 RNA polymerase sigma factor [Thermanaeromonas toyohensis ToBE]
MRQLPLGADPNHLLSLARKGNDLAREELIRKFTPFILNIVSRLSGRFVRLGEDDEASIGLMAFNEAIDTYDPRKGVSFLTLAETVIRRRIIDYFRQEERHRQHLATQDIQVSSTPEDHHWAWELVDRREEIVRYQKELASYGISFADLVRNCPRHQDARQRALACARTIADNPLLRRYLEEKKELPLKALGHNLKTSRKTLERHRKYIIALALIIMGDYDYLKEYISQAERGESNGG